MRGRQVYSVAGDFTVWGRAWTSMKENMLLYGLVGSLGAAGELHNGLCAGAVLCCCCHLRQQR